MRPIKRLLMFLLLFAIEFCLHEGSDICLNNPCACCKSGQCADPKVHKFPCDNCTDGFTGPSCYEPCPENCVNCSQTFFEYDTDQICFQCREGYYNGRYLDVEQYPLKQDCSLSCKPGCASCKKYSQCLRCKNGFYLTSQEECDNCLANCDQCSSVNTCSKCVDGYVWTVGTCQKCKPNCKICDLNGTCKECNEGFYLNGPDCLQCNPECLSCSRANDCNDCRKGFYLDKNGCFDCRDRCLSCSLKNQNKYMCDKCEKGFYPSNDVCLQCGRGCDSCFSNTICNVCDKKHKLHNGVCYLCPSDCIACSSDNYCTACQYAFYNIKGNCFPCSNNCESCLDSDSCSTCKRGYFGTLCTSECQPNCKNNVCKMASGDCSGCKERYFEDNHHCTKCPDHCDVCNSRSSCDRCDAGYMGNICEYECVNCKKGTTCDKSSGYCFDACKDGFSGKNCDQQCSSYCFSCDRSNPSRCFSCATDRFGTLCLERCPSNCKNDTCHAVDGSCVLGCKPGFWGGTCRVNCSRNCDICDQNNGNCTRCSKSYGNMCQYSCSDGCVDKECERKTGECSKGCQKGYQGKHCITVAENSVAVVVVPVVIVLLLAVVVGFIACWRYRKRSIHFTDTCLILRKKRNSNKEVTVSVDEINEDNQDRHTDEHQETKPLMNNKESSEQIRASTVVEVLIVENGRQVSYEDVADKTPLLDQDIPESERRPELDYTETPDGPKLNQMSMSVRQISPDIEILTPANEEQDDTVDGSRESDSSESEYEDTLESHEEQAKVPTAPPRIKRDLRKSMDNLLSNNSSIKEEEMQAGADTKPSYVKQNDQASPILRQKSKSLAMLPTEDDSSASTEHAKPVAPPRPQRDNRKSIENLTSSYDGTRGKNAEIGSNPKPKSPVKVEEQMETANKDKTSDIPIVPQKDFEDTVIPSSAHFGPNVNRQVDLSSANEGSKSEDKHDEAGSSSTPNKITKVDNTMETVNIDNTPDITVIPEMDFQGEMDRDISKQSATEESQEHCIDEHQTTSVKTEEFKRDAERKLEEIGKFSDESSTYELDNYSSDTSVTDHNEV